MSFLFSSTAAEGLHKIREGSSNQEQLHLARSLMVEGDSHTSGKVPLEKTLKVEGISCCAAHDKVQVNRECNSHQEAGFSTCTISNDHEFP